MKTKGLIKYCLFLIFCLFLSTEAFPQIKILFDATKAESAGNADWVIDADVFNLYWTTSGIATTTGNESNAQRIPTPAQSGITSSTTEGYWKGALSSWGIDLVKKGYAVETLPYGTAITYNNTSNPQDLSNYKVFVVCEPNIQFTAAEKTAIFQFVQNGGGLFMVSDHTLSDRNNDGWDAPAIWNDLMTSNTVASNPFGISFDLVDVSPSPGVMANLPTDTLLHGSMGNVTQVKWSNGCTMPINTTANPTVKGIVYNNGASNTGTTNVLVARANYGLGRVVGIGDSSPCDDGTGDTGDVLYDGWITDASGNHEKLIINATIWLASSPSTSNVGINEVSGGIQLKAFPNPASDQFYISISGAQTQDVSIKVYNTMGEELFLPIQVISDSKIKLNTNALKNGLYFIIAETHGERLLRKISVLKN